MTEVRSISGKINSASRWLSDKRAFAVDGMSHLCYSLEIERSAELPHEVGLHKILCPDRQNRSDLSDMAAS